ADGTRDRVGVRGRGKDPGMGLRDARGRDHLLGLEDLLHALGGTDPLLVNPLLGSHVSPRAGGCVLRRVPPPGRRHLASAADDLLLLDVVGAHAARLVGAGLGGLGLAGQEVLLHVLEDPAQLSSVSDSNSCVSRMVDSTVPLCLRCSSSWASKSRTSSTSMSSNLPVLPAQMDTTCSSIGNGELWACLSSSISRAPRFSCCLDASSRSEANIAKDSRSRY